MTSVLVTGAVSCMQWPFGEPRFIRKGDPQTAIRTVGIFSFFRREVPSAPGALLVTWVELTVR